MKGKLEARKEMCKMLKQMLREDMKAPYGDSLKKGLQKVTVASDSPEGLKEGLSKAEKILNARMGMSPEEKEEESESEEMEESEEESEKLDLPELLKMMKAKSK